MLFDDSYERYWNRDDVCKNTTNLTGHSKYQIFEVQNCTIAYTLKILRNHLMTVQKESCPFQLITFVKFVHIRTSYTHNCKICAHFWNLVLLNLTRHESDIPLLPNHIVQNDPTICLWHWGWTLAVSIYYLIYSTRNLWWRSKPTFT